MNKPEFVIASTGRSGSGYISKVLRAYGIDCGHEEYWRFPWQEPQEVEGDSSWLAVKYLDEFDGIVFHQVRNPLHVLTSLMNTYSKDTKYSRKYFPFRKDVMPYRTGDLMRDFMAMIVWMNKEIARYATHTWKLDQIYHAHVGMVAIHCGKEYDVDKAKEAIKSVSKSYNSHHDSDYLSWGDIPYSEEKKKIMEQAGKYGYKIPNIKYNW